MTSGNPPSAAAGADLSNWRTSPYSRWAFRNVGQLIATEVVENDPANVSSLRHARNGKSESMLRTLFLKATATDAFVMLSDGEIVYECYSNGNDAATPHILMSATKSVVGLITGLLEARGAIDLGFPVARYVPESAGTAYANATLRQLLDMRSGVVLNEVDEIAYNRASGWNPVSSGEPAQGLHAFFASLTSLPAAHGGDFRYVSANTDLLAWAIERAAGKSLASLLSEELWVPMGAERPAFITVDRKGAPRATGGLCATARDFARVGQLLVDGGHSGSRQVLPPSLIEDIERGGDADAWARGEWGKAFAPISKTMRYRSGWYVVEDEPQHIFAMGIHGQNLFVDRANRIVIAKFSSWAQPTDYINLPATHIAVRRLQRSKAG